MFIDVAKYILTIVVIGALASEQISIKMIFVGFFGASIFGALGYRLIPVEEVL